MKVIRPRQRAVPTDVLPGFRWLILGPTKHGVSEDDMLHALRHHWRGFETGDPDVTTFVGPSAHGEPLEVGVVGRPVPARRGHAILACVLRLGTVVLGADDVERAVGFWANAFGYEAVSFPGSDDGFTILVPPDRDGTRIAVHRSNTPVQERPRVHLDLVVDSAAEQMSETDRLVGLGATRVPWDYPSDPDFVVLADPEGNRFCIVDASHG